MHPHIREGCDPIFARLRAYLIGQKKRCADTLTHPFDLEPSKEHPLI